MMISALQKPSIFVPQKSLYFLRFLASIFYIIGIIIQPAKKPTASPKSALTTFGSGPSTLAPSSGDSKRKVEEKAPDIQKLMKKAKCDSSRDAKEWHKEYEERKKFAMAAFKS